MMIKTFAKFERPDSQRRQSWCMIALNVIVAGLLGYLTGRWVLQYGDPAIAQAFAGFTGWMSVLALEYGRILTRVYFAFAKTFGGGPTPWR